MQAPTVTMSSYSNYPNPLVLPTMGYQYDINGRMTEMTSNGSTFATASYTAAGQLYQLSYGGMTETRTYNSMMQLISQSAPGYLSMTYNYSATQNNGRITSSVDGITGENTSYTYDSLNRLTAASNSLWSQSYTYDGFGNLLTKSQANGSPNPSPAMSVSYNANNQQTSGVSYDANGNTTSGNAVTNGYTVENKMNSQTSNYYPWGVSLYGYDPWGKRVMKETNPDPWDYEGEDAPSWEFYFYTITGQRLVTMDCNNPSGNPLPSCTVVGESVYFKSKMLVSNGVYIVTDRLGSVRANTQGNSFAYYPYGDEHSANANGLDKFATYFRDGVGQDYADQRYYNSGIGRFWNVDPGGMATASPGNPTSWNRYAYVNGDPINFNDPRGLDSTCGPFATFDGEGCIYTSGSAPSGTFGCNDDWATFGEGCVMGDDAGVGCYGSGSGFAGQPDPGCSTGGGSSDPTSTPPPDCGQSLAASGFLPGSATGLALVAVLMGEDSWSLIGTQQYVPGNTLGHPTGLVITQSTVGLEESLMLDVIANQATAHHLSILAQATAPGFALGYQTGLTDVNSAEMSAVGSSQCNHLTLASISVDTFISGGSVASGPYNQWRAIVQINPKTGKHFLVKQQPGYYVVGGTIFYTIKNP